MYLRRQIAVRVCNDIVDSLAEGTVFTYSLSDVLPKYVLKLASGKVIQDYIDLDAGESFSLPLPANYDTDEKLCVTIRSNERIKVVVVDPDLGTSTHLVMASSGTTDGDHEGILMWQGRVTSITVSVPATFDTAQIEFFMWEIPDLTIPASWRTGSQAIGYVENDDA
jgi:hypothetical protein